MKITVWIVAALAVICATGVAQATPVSGVNIKVVPWLAPNAYGSPSFDAAAANAVQGIYQGLTSYGAPGTPTYFQEQSNVTSNEVIVTGFPSWKGHADPGAVYGPAFANELGNRMHFGLLATGYGGAKFSISQLSFTMASTDPAHGLDYTFSGGYTYSNQFEGILYGPDGKLGGGDDTFITSGSSSQLVDALVGRGSGNSFAAYCSSCTIAQQQAAIDAAGAYPGTPFDFTGTYMLNDWSGSGTFHISPSAVPEPSSTALMLIGAAGLFGVGFGRRRTARRITAPA